jgi:GntR family transcriptional regulator/MocR family aminotransferase
LPSTRDLVGQLGASRNTIVYAFEQLVAEGYLDSRVGSGMYVADLLIAERAISKAAAATVPAISQPQISHRASLLSEINVAPEYPTPRVRPFRPCQPAVERFPIRTWNRARSYALRSKSNELFFEADSIGLPRLRRAVGDYLREARGVRCDVDQIIITAGAQQALSLIGTSLIDRGDPVWIEDPGYLGARAALVRAGAKLIPIPIDDEGLTIPFSRRSKLPQLIYTTPSRQFPLGTTMTLLRRLALLEFARTSGAWVIEDDYDSEFRYVGRPMPSLQGLASHECVIYVGSFSKVLFASLRLGYLVVPHDLVAVFRKGKEIQAGSSSAIDQATAAVFIEEGFFSTHVRRMRELYRERRDIFLYEAEKHLSSFLTFPSIDAGMDAIGYLPANTDDLAVSKRLQAEGIDAPPLSAYSLRTCSPGLVFGFTAFSPSEMRTAILTISRVLSDRLTRSRISV